MDLTADQQTALAAITAAEQPSGRFLVTGFAGTGKTTLMEHVVKAMLDRDRKVVVTAPTHKAVAVLASKLAKAELTKAPCRTIHSLLSLRAKPDQDRLTFARNGFVEPVAADVVIIDECSMLGADLMAHIRRHLPNAFVLFVGDPAQLPPVNEPESEAFSIEQRFHLDTIVRQAAGNPVLETAHQIRSMQGGPADWSWCKTVRDGSRGVFMPGAAIDAWIKKAFTSKEFDADPNRFRYLAWTNKRVAQVNTKVRRWRYGDNLTTPFVVGERALLRAPIVMDGDVWFNTNEEAEVIAIEQSPLDHRVDGTKSHKSWRATVPAWKLTLKREDGVKLEVHMPADDAALDRATARFKGEQNWKGLHEFQSSLARLQSIYALTVHNAQGSTVTNAFVDVSNIRRREGSDLLEMQRMLYVAATRPTDALVLAGV